MRDDVLFRMSLRYFLTTKGASVEQGKNAWSLCVIIKKLCEREGTYNITYITGSADPRGDTML